MVHSLTRAGNGHCLDVPRAQGHIEAWTWLDLETADGDR